MQSARVLFFHVALAEAAGADMADAEGMTVAGALGGAASATAVAGAVLGSSQAIVQRRIAPMVVVVFIARASLLSSRARELRRRRSVHFRQHARDFGRDQSVGFGRCE